jgi:sarcosine oxidase subunit beta
VRLQFSDEINIELALRSMAAHEQFSMRPGGDIGLRQVGYLFLLSDQGNVEMFVDSVRLQNSMGVPSRMLTPDEAQVLSPLIATEGVLAASFCRRDGHCDPEAVVQGYAAASRGMGVRILQRTKVSSIELDGQRIVGVHTTAGFIPTNTVINAAGAWAAQVGDMVGCALPVEPVSRPIWYTEPITDRPDPVPMTIDFETGFYFHAEGHGVLFGMADPDQPAGFDAPLRNDWLEVTGEVVARRAPRLTEVGIAGGWTGFYETTPDHNALIGRAADIDRFFYCTGFSGHGFQLGPAVGEVMRDLVLEREPVVDVSGFAVERFATSAGRPERNIV